MIGIKDAVTVAKDFVLNVYEANLPDLRLEEVGRSDDEKYWLVTLGYTQERTSLPQLAKLMNPFERVYKTIKVDAEKGEAISMQIRQV